MIEKKDQAQSVTTPAVEIPAREVSSEAVPFETVSRVEADPVGDALKKHIEDGKPIGYDSPEVKEIVRNNSLEGSVQAETPEVLNAHSGKDWDAVLKAKKNKLPIAE